MAFKRYVLKQQKIYCFVAFCGRHPVNSLRHLTILYNFCWWIYIKSVDNIFFLYVKDLFLKIFVFIIFLIHSSKYTYSTHYKSFLFKSSTCLHVNPISDHSISEPNYLILVFKTFPFLQLMKFLHSSSVVHDHFMKMWCYIWGYHGNQHNQTNNNHAPCDRSAPAQTNEHLRSIL